MARDFRNAPAKLREYYDPFPGPDEAAFNAADKLSTNLAGTNALRTVGIIACAYGASGWLYVAFSPDLQNAIRTRWNRATDKSMSDWMAQVTGAAKVWYCRSVSKSIVKTAGKNPGCAEKKIVSAMYSYGERMTGIAIVEHPEGTPSARLSAHTPLVSDVGQYIGPCATCKAVYRAYMAPAPVAAAM